MSLICPLQVPLFSDHNADRAVVVANHLQLLHTRMEVSEACFNTDAADGAGDRFVVLWVLFTIKTGQMIMLAKGEVMEKDVPK